MTNEGIIKQEIRALGKRGETMNIIAKKLSRKYGFTTFSLYWWPRKNFKAGYLKRV